MAHDFETAEKIIFIFEELKYHMDQFQLACGHFDANILSYYRINKNEPVSPKFLRHNVNVALEKLLDCYLHDFALNPEHVKLFNEKHNTRKAPPKLREV